MLLSDFNDFYEKINGTNNCDFLEFCVWVGDEGVSLQKGLKYNIWTPDVCLLMLGVSMQKKEKNLR